MIYIILFGKEENIWAEETTFPSESEAINYVIDAQADPITILEFDDANDVCTPISGRALSSLISAYAVDAEMDRRHNLTLVAS